MIELRIVNTKLATALFKAGVRTLPPEVLNGVKVFVFQYDEGQQALVNGIFRKYR